MAQIFISHSGTDREQAAELLTWLHAQGFVSTFLDFDERRGIAPGADWERTLYRELCNADAVILVLTNNWFRSKWCFVEFAQARALGKAIFPLIETATKEKFVSSDIQHLDLVKDREGGMERLRAELTRVSLDSPGGFPWDAKRPPYPGLSAFAEADAAIYFGRADEIRRLIERLNARRAQGGEKLVVVLGSSGSGKSSLLRAGVLPRLKRDAHNWIVLPPFRPQLHALDAMAQAISIGLGDASNWRQWRSALEAEDLPHALSELACDLRAARKENEAEILVSVDQGEELLGATDAKQADQFFAVLNAMLNERLPFLVVMTLRSDYLGRLQRESRLAAPFEQFSLKPMPLERIRDIILGPARTAGIAVDEALVSAAMADARTDDALPLLAFAMRELYGRSGEGKHLTADAYHALGDAQAQLSPLENAVRRRADEVLNDAKPTPEDLQALKEAFIPAMVRVNPEGEYARRPAAMAALPSRAMALIGRLAEARLLTIRQEQDATLVEVAHEALLRKWPLLHGWLDEERDFLIGKDQLENDLLDWQRATAAQKTEALLWGLKLARAQAWLTAKPRQLTAPERAFIEASVQYAAARRRMHMLRTMGALVGGLCLLFGIAIAYQVSKKHEAVAAEKAARLTTSETDLAFAAEEMERGETPVSLAFLGDALDKNPQNASAIALAIAELRNSEIPLSALRHGNEVQDADFSPDGTRVVTASADGSARVWSTQTGQQIGSDLKHTDWVHTAEFSPDGSLVVTASYDGTAGVWDVGTGRELHVLHHAANSKVYSAHFSKDGNYIVTASLDRTARVWDAHTGLPVGEPLPSGDTVWDAVFDPNDDMRVLTGSADGSAGLWDVRTGKQLLKNNKYDGEVSCIAFSPDGKWFVVAAGDGKAQIWDAHTLHPTGKLLLHDKNAPVYAVSFSPDTSHPEVATASADDTARLWKVPSGEPIGRPMDHAGWVRAVNFSSDGRWIVTASYDRTARVWNAQSATAASPPMRHSGAVYMAHFDPRNNQIVVTASFDHTARIWRWHDTKALPPLKGPDVLERACWDSKAQRILTVSDTGTQIWDSRTGQPTGQRIPTGSAGTIAACSSDGQWLVTASGANAQIWNPGTGRPVTAPFHLPAAPLTPDTGRGLRFDPQNEWFAVIANQGVWLWDAKTGRPVSASPIQMKGSTILGANFSPDGSMIATYSREGAAAIWSVPGGLAVGKPLTHDGKITTASFSPDGKLLLTASSDHTARVWNVLSGAQVGILHLDSWVPDAEFSPDGKWIVTACADFTAQVWDAGSYKPAGQLMRNNAAVIHVEFSPDGRWVLTLSGDGVAQVWDARTGDPVIEPFKGPQPDQSQPAGASFSADGNWIVTFWNDASKDKSTRVWQVNLQEAPITGTSAPQWLISLAKGVGGLSVSPEGALEPTPESDDPVLLRDQLTGLPTTDAMDRFGRWLISDPETRPASPQSDQ